MIRAQIADWGNEMTQKHKHADVLIAIAEGKEVEYLHPATFIWELSDNTSVNPLLQLEYEWRIKPEPKPDVEVYVGWENVITDELQEIPKESVTNYAHAIKLTFDAETNEYKSTEVIK